MASILIVEDSATEAAVHSMALKNAGHQTAIAENGEVAIDMAKTHKPDVILMDIVMPGMNGFQATRKLARDPETQNIPIIITSTKGQESDIVYGQRQGAVEYLVKPIAGDTLVTTVARVLAG